MASPTNQTDAPVTEQAFLQDRQSFLSSFLNFTTGAIILIVTLLVLLWLFIA